MSCIQYLKERTMNPADSEMCGHDLMAQKESYKKPMVTTFGSVAKLTHGTHSAGNDHSLGKTKNIKN